MAKVALDTSTIETESDIEPSGHGKRKRKLTVRARALSSSSEDSGLEENISAQQQAASRPSPRSKNPVHQKGRQNLTPVKSCTSACPAVCGKTKSSLSSAVHTVNQTTPDMHVPLVAFVGHSTGDQHLSSKSPSLTTDSATNAACAIIQTTPTTCTLTTAMSGEQHSNSSLDSRNDCRNSVTTGQFTGMHNIFNSYT
jgi:hypothetical protein